MDKYIVVFRTSGSMEVVKYDKDDDSQVRNLIGGWLEVLGYIDDLVILGDEDGRSKNLPVNPTMPRYLGDIVVVKNNLCELDGLNQSDVQFMNAMWARNNEVL